jgi:alanyl-tRNA synthetase
VEALKGYLEHAYVPLTSFMCCRQGSLVTPDRLRFDFNLHRGLKEQEIARIEELVNGWIAEDTALSTREMPLSEAKAAGMQTPPP